MDKNIYKLMEVSTIENALPTSEIVSIISDPTGSISATFASDNSSVILVYEGTPSQRINQLRDRLKDFAKRAGGKLSYSENPSGNGKLPWSRALTSQSNPQLQGIGEIVFVLDQAASKLNPPVDLDLSEILWNEFEENLPENIEALKIENTNNWQLIDTTRLRDEI